MNSGSIEVSFLINARPHYSQPLGSYFYWRRPQGPTFFSRNKSPRPPFCGLAIGSTWSWLATQREEAIRACTSFPMYVLKMSDLMDMRGVPVRCESLHFQLPQLLRTWKQLLNCCRRQRVRRKKTEMREKVGKSRFTAFFK